MKRFKRNILKRELLNTIKGGNSNSSSNSNDEDSLGNTIRPRTSGIGGLMRPK